MPTSVENNSVFRIFFKKQKLTIPNFIDWYRQLRLVLSTEDKENYLEHPILEAHVAPPGQQVPLVAVAAHAAWVKGCVQNYNMHGMGKTVNELYAMLKLHEDTLPKKDTNPALHAIRAGRGLRGSKKLKLGALSLYVGDGHHAAVEAIGTYHLELPSGLLIVLNNCHYAPSITRGVISVSRLFDDGFINRFDENNVILVSKNNLVYFMAIIRDGIFEIHMSCSNTNDSSMYAISNKRAKINLDSSLLWHCRLGHISKKRIEKLQHDGLINSIDIESLGKCVSCLFGKMTRKPYSHQVERAKDLLGLIHTDEHGIISHRTPPYTPQYNGVLERRNRTLLDMVRSMMSQTTLPKSFWDYAFETAARILNMVPTKKVYLRRIPKETMGYSFYGPSENKVFVAQNTEFFENDLIDLKSSGSVEDLELIQQKDKNPSLDTSLDHEEDDQKIDEPQSDTNLIRKSSKTRRAPDRMCLYIDAKEHELGDLGEPANYKAALLDLEFKKWLDAMNVEMQSMKDNDVWVLVELPPNARTVGSKWLFKKKTNMNGTIYVFKAHLVAKGFTQTYGVDYEETFSPVADIRAIRILIAIVAYYNYEIWQMDVKTAFLNGHLFEEVYMEQPGGFVNPKYLNHVCKLKRSIYGLKQASRKWNKRFDDEIKKFGFTQNRDESCVYQKASGSYVAILILYVNDILLMGNNIPMLQDVKSYIGRSFAMKDLGDAAYILGIKICRDRSKRYLRNTKDMFLVYGGVVNWKSTKQSIFATSSADAEYIAAFDASKEAVWISKFIFGLSIVPTIEEPISMYCDNTGAITIAKDDGVTIDARHFHVKVHYLCETIKLGDVKIEKVDTYDNLADPFAKALAFPKHSELTRNVGMLPASSFM
uniref:Integrase catalytic domain-containing protein n=1 Tax=Tanacetum cinerariifolium TaxID=118510 RepID=A0A6L2JHY7_TANCI|nr:hypothetical protein [Tanacetum cinerariifolium]